MPCSGYLAATAKTASLWSAGAVGAPRLCCYALGACMARVLLVSSRPRMHLLQVLLCSYVCLPCLSSLHHLHLQLLLSQARPRPTPAAWNKRSTCRLWSARCPVLLTHQDETHLVASPQPTWVVTVRGCFWVNSGHRAKRTLWGCGSIYGGMASRGQKWLDCGYGTKRETPLRVLGQGRNIAQTR